MSATMKKMKPKRMPLGVTQRWTIVAVVGVVCLALVLTVFFVVGGTDGKPAPRIEAQETTPGSTAPGSSTPAAQAVQIESVVVPPLSIYRRRNPFVPLIDMETSATAATTASGASAVIVAPPELVPDQSESVISRAVTLEAVWEQDGMLLARLRVGEDTFDRIGVGDIFADNFKLVSLGKDSSATVLYGDERFSVFAGQSIYW